MATGCDALLALAGLIATGYFNLQFVGQHGGINLVDFRRRSFASPAAASIGRDITVAFPAFLAWPPGEATR